MYPTDRNTVLGAGYLFFDQLLNEATGQYAGELYLANTPSLELAIAAGGNIQDFDADGAIATLTLDVDTQVTRSFTFTAKHINSQMLGLFMPGTVSAVTTTAGALTAQPINAGNGVKEGYWYQLGADLAVGGVRAVTSVSVKGAGPVTHVLDTDYKLDATMARIYIVPGGGIDDDDILTADFTKTAVSWESVSALAQPTVVKGRLRFISANSAGTERDVFIPLCHLTPNGNLAWKSRDTVQQMGFNAKVQVPTGGVAPIVITTRAA